jgi:hypothetical protein
MSTKTFGILQLIAAPIIGGIIASVAIGDNQAQAHWLQDQPYHAHVCTLKDPLTVRASYSKSSKSLGSLPKGTVVTVLGTYSHNNEDFESWTHIKFNKTTGFVSSNFICY